jgi:hypothetical protein
MQQKSTQLRSKRPWHWVCLLIALLALILLVTYWPGPAKENDSQRAANPKVAPLAQPAPQLSLSPKIARDDSSNPPRSLPDEATIQSLRARVKLNLSTIYAAQKSFFADFGHYSTDLVFIGWSPNVAQMDFKLGFLQPFQPSKPAVAGGTEEDPSRMDSDEFLGVLNHDQSEPGHYTKAAEAISLAEFERFCRKGCTANTNSFEVLVILPLGESGKVDVWTINESKKLQQVWDGVSGKALR